MMNKATTINKHLQTMTWGPAQLGIAQGVLEQAVAEGLVEATQELLVTSRSGSTRRPTTRLRCDRRREPGR